MESAGKRRRGLARRAGRRAGATIPSSPAGPIRRALPFAGAGANIDAAMDEAPALDYPRMIRDALRGVVREALALAAAEGLPDDHHFFIGFRSADPGVRMPAFLRDLHPEELTIVIQHQYWDLEVDAEAFSVTLTFGGSRHRLTVPFAAVVTFADPAVSFGLRFDGASPDGEEEEARGAGSRRETAGGDGKTAAVETPPRRRGGGQRHPPRPLPR